LSELDTAALPQLFLPQRLLLQGRALLGLNRHREAMSTLSNALSLAEARQDWRLMTELKLTLAQACNQAGLPEEALKYVSFEEADGDDTMDGTSIVRRLVTLA